MEMSGKRMPMKFNLVKSGWVLRMSAQSARMAFDVNGGVPWRLGIQ
jgi:hypothetical protein